MVNLSKFNTDDLLYISKLLNLYANKKLSNLALEHFGNILGIDKNEKSGIIYIVDDNYNVLLLNNYTGFFDLWNDINSYITYINNK